MATDWTHLISTEKGRKVSIILLLLKTWTFGNDLRNEL